MYNIEFCTECRRETKYFLKKEKATYTLENNKEFDYIRTVAICSECGAYMSINELIDKNIKELDTQYRAKNNLITIDEIETISKVYNIKIEPLSHVLNISISTLNRYLAGQFPSAKYSNKLKKVLSDPNYMKQLLVQNKNKLTQVAFNKAINTTNEIIDLFSFSDKLKAVILRLFENLGEITPLALQKLLYFTQGISFALTKHEMFNEDCQAWQHGEVYPCVYHAFKSFKYNTIDDIRFIFISKTTSILSENEKRIVDLVTDTFGLYSGKTLEKIVHNELPWLDARKGLNKNERSNEVITKNSICSYFTDIKGLSCVLCKLLK